MELGSSSHFYCRCRRLRVSCCAICLATRSSLYGALAYIVKHDVGMGFFYACQTGMAPYKKKLMRNKIFEWIDNNRKRVMLTQSFRDAAVIIARDCLHEKNPSVELLVEIENVLHDKSCSCNIRESSLYVRTTYTLGAVDLLNLSSHR